MLLCSCSALLYSTLPYSTLLVSSNSLLYSILFYCTLLCSALSTLYSNYSIYFTLFYWRVMTAFVEHYMSSCTQSGHTMYHSIKYSKIKVTYPACIEGNKNRDLPLPHIFTSLPLTICRNSVYNSVLRLPQIKKGKYYIKMRQEKQCSFIFSFI